MKKIIILSYFYPPANFVGSVRVASWVKYLKDYNYYSVVITRQWNQDQKDITGQLKNNNLVVDKSKYSEVHRLPFKRSLRDKLTDYPKLKIFQKALTLLEVILSHFFVKSIPYSNFYNYTCKYIEANPDVTTVLISARPFQLFFIGYKLKKRYPKINWIADYRDDWTTGMTYTPEGFLNKFIHYLDKPFEKKWLSNARFITSASQSVTEAISDYIKKPGFPVLNGFDETDEVLEKNVKKQENETFKILYSGTLYSNQRVEVLIKAVSQINEKIEVFFVGADIMPIEWNRLKNLSKTYEFIKLVPRQPKEKMHEQMTSADVFFATGYEGMNGFVPVKCFDYLAWETPVILCPSDNGEIEKFIKTSSCGMVADNEEDCIKVLSSWIKQKRETGELIFPRNDSEKTKYSRKYQTKILAELLDSI